MYMYMCLKQLREAKKHETIVEDHIYIDIPQRKTAQARLVHFRPRSHSRTRLSTTHFQTAQFTKAQGTSQILASRIVTRPPSLPSHRAGPRNAQEHSSTALPHDLANTGARELFGSPQISMMDNPAPGIPSRHRAHCDRKLQITPRAFVHLSVPRARLEPIGDLVQGLRGWILQHLGHQAVAAKHFIEEAEKWVQANSSKLKQLAQEAHPDPSWQDMESSILNLALTAFRRRLAKEEALAAQRHDRSDHKEGGSGQVGSALVAASSVGCALFLHQRGRLAIGANNGSTQTKTYFCMHVLWLGLCCVLLESLQTESGTAAIKTSKSTSLGWQRTWIARTSSTTPGQCGNGLATLQAQRLGREVGFLLLQTRVD